ncbi:Prolyl tripeptidyl peptidase precursor [Bacteroidales bacterium Barb6]|nr:Prolyl tripeptidyl peptidase precursor [Bacteroidales bacterium Barb6]
MKQLAVSILIWAVSAAGLTAQQGSRQVTLQEAVGGDFRQATAVGEMRPATDGEHYTATNKERTMIIRYAYRTGQPTDTLFDVRKARECTFDTFDEYEISGNGHHILVWRDVERLYRRSFKATVYDYDVRRNYVKPLTDTGRKAMIPTFSPDGRMCSYVIDNNIWIRKFDFDTELQITRDGETNRVLNGTTDWVYEEEFAVTSLMAWSPDSDCLAFVRSDETEVPEYSMQMYGKGLYPDFHIFKYPKAGERNSTVTLHAYNIQTRDTKKMELPADAETYIPRILFTTNTDQLAVLTLNRHQNIFNMYYANPKSGVFRLILRDENKAYINSDWLYDIRFTAAGFTYVSEKDGYAHIYQYSPTGILQRQVTQGNWDVTAYLGTDEITKTVYYESAEESPLRRSVYAIDSKGAKTRLTAQEGTNRATFSSNFAYFVNSYSNANTPARITVNETKSRKELRVLQDNAALRTKLADYAFSPKEFITIRTASDIELNAWIIKPADFDPAKKYPVLMTQYSGPGSQEVLDQYSFGWEQYLAANGIIVVSVDGRGTGARGEAFRKCTYLRMGELESCDQTEAAQALARYPYIDGSRIAIWGWSFGGYNTLMAMTTGNGTFKAGIAVAPPTDWKYYDTIYTERFMRTPKENFEGYAATSPLERAKDLQGKLLLVHGTADDNVHFMQSLAYAEALVQAGKQFDMHVYQDRNHSINGGNTRLHLYTKMSNFLFDNL